MTAAALALEDAAVLWSAGLARGAVVILAACDALAAGLDGPALGMLAGLSTRDGENDVHRYLAPALEEQGLASFAPYSDEGRDAAGRAMARAMLAGETTPRQLAADIHRVFGHELASTEELAVLDDVYDSLDYTHVTFEETDARVAAEARRLVGEVP